MRQRLFHPWVGLGVLLFVAISTRLVLYVDNAPEWDPSAYVGIGKDLWSSGGSGLIEPMRPIPWPLWLGAAWKADVDPLWWGKWSLVVATLGWIALTYAVGKRALDATTGLVAAALLTCSPLLLHWGQHLYSAIPATALLLLSVWLALGRHWFLAGLCLALAALTRFVVFLGILAFVPWAIALWRSGQRRPILRGILGGLAAGLPYLLYNQLRFGHPFRPFLDQAASFGAYESIWGEGAFFYISFLVQHESALLVFNVAALIVLRKKRDASAWLVWLSAPVFLLFFSTSRVQLIRYILPALPFLYLGASIGVVTVVRWLPRQLAPAFGLLLAAAMVWQLGRAYPRLEFVPGQPDVFQNTAAQFEDRSTGDESIWISNPTMLVHTDLRATELVYYPLFDPEQARRLLDSIDGADLVMLSRYDIPCSPEGDPECRRLRRELFDRLGSELRELWSSRDRRGLTEAGILPALIGVALFDGQTKSIDHARRRFAQRFGSLRDLPGFVESVHLEVRVGESVEGGRASRLDL